jgi:hypothetical protein
MSQVHFANPGTLPLKISGSFPFTSLPVNQPLQVSVAGTLCICIQTVFGSICDAISGCLDFFVFFSVSSGVFQYILDPWYIDRGLLDYDALWYLYVITIVSVDILPPSSGWKKTTLDFLITVIASYLRYIDARCAHLLSNVHTRNSRQTHHPSCLHLKRCR